MFAQPKRSTNLRNRQQCSLPADRAIVLGLNVRAANESREAIVESLYVIYRRKERTAMARVSSCPTKHGMVLVNLQLARKDGGID